MDKEEILAKIKNARKDTAGIQKVKNAVQFTPETIDGTQYEGNGVIPESDDLDIGEAIEIELDNKKKIKDANKEKARANEAKKKAERKELMIRQPKRGSVLNANGNWLFNAIRGLRVILRDSNSVVYQDELETYPHRLMGHPAYGKECLRNAFEHLHNLQTSLLEGRGKNPEDAIPWLIISNTTSYIADHNIATKLEALKPSTGIACAYGVEFIRPSGRWYDVLPADQPRIRGHYYQCNTENTDEDVVIGHEYKKSQRYRVLIADGPFIAIRGALFNQINFKEAAKSYEGGFYHYMADLSMEAYARGFATAAIHTIGVQFVDPHTLIGTEAFEKDQKVFTARWQKQFPASITTTPKAPPVSK